MSDGQNGQTAFERGIQLFNNGEFFLAHDAWEDWWRATTHPDKQTSQGIVQIAVAMHHVSTGNLAGARSVMERALRNLQGAADDFRGLDMVQLRADIRSVIRQLESKKAIERFQLVRN